jgi:hypothetical protein
MWWNTQNVDLARTDSNGRVWHFRVWHDTVEGTNIQRIFFWDELRSETGIIELVGDRTRHVSRIKQLMAKLVTDPEFRARYRRDILFPVERKYAAYEPLEGTVGQE